MGGLLRSPAVPPIYARMCGRGDTACPIHSPNPPVSGSGHVATSPVCPSCPSPSFLLVWTNVSSLSPWLLDFHAVRFSVRSVFFFLYLNRFCPSFGCARRRSVSTYASILVSPPKVYFLNRNNILLSHLYMLSFSTLPFTFGIP